MAPHFAFDERFVEAFAHDEHVVLGFKLRPYSLWHELNLQLIDSPVLTGEPISLMDLINAVSICRSSYVSGAPIPQIGLPRRGWRRWLWTWRISRHAKIRPEVHLFERYLVDYGSGPKFWPNQHKGGGGDDRDFDEILEQAALVWRETGCGEAYAWNMPIGSVRWYSALFAKMAGGDVQIWTPLHEEMKKKNDEKREATIAAEAADIAAKESIPLEEAKARATKNYWKKVESFFANQAAKR
jgi:hypothetical protein